MWRGYIIGYMCNIFSELLIQMCTEALVWKEVVWASFFFSPGICPAYLHCTDGLCKAVNMLDIQNISSQKSALGSLKNKLRF